MRPLYLELYRLIYPLPDEPLTRQRPLEVLALGISRAGTESLRNALIELGYYDVHHGIRFLLSDRERLQWLRLAWAQHTHNAAGLTTADFDRVLGDCAAVTDMPACGFAQELLTAYPDAKVVLNYRPDVEAWYQSMLELETLGRTQTRKAYVLSWFQSDLFWQQRVATYWLRGRHFKGDFRKNGKAWYAEHYRSLEERLTREGRPFLKWKVDDGWCVYHFLQTVHHSVCRVRHVNSALGNRCVNSSANRPCRRLLPAAPCRKSSTHRCPGSSSRDGNRPRRTCRCFSAWPSLC